MFKRLVLLSLLLPIALWSQNRAGENYTNLFADDSQKLNLEIKKRAASSVLLSGTKLGVKIGFGYVFNEQPALVPSFFADLPISKYFSASMELGPQSANITNYTNSQLSTNITGTGKIDYLAVTGTFRIFIKSFWIAPGFSFHVPISGSINAVIPGENTRFHNYPINDAQGALYGLLSFGYMAEIKENIFVMPEVYGGYKLDFTTFPSRIMLNVNLGLAFKL